MKKIIKNLIIVCCMLAPVFLLAACGKPDEIDISGYADQKIEISGIGDGPVSVTIGDLKQMDCATVTTESTSDKIGEVRATGVWLNTLLKPYGIKQKQIKKITITGEDDYDISLRQEYLKKHPVMLAFGINGKPLDEDAVPCRIIIKRSDSAYWVRRVTQIQIER